MTPHEEMLQRFQVYPSAPIIATPGKYEGCPLWVPYYWELAMDGFADFHDLSANESRYSFILEPNDVACWPELKDVERITLWKNKTGYAMFSTHSSWEYESGPQLRLPEPPEPRDLSITVAGLGASRVRALAPSDWPQAVSVWLWQNDRQGVDNLNENVVYRALVALGWNHD